MSYYATGSGTLVFKEPATKETEDLIKSEFDVLDVRNTEVSLYFDGKYYEEEIIEILEKIEPLLHEGCIEFKGEDDCIWRYITRGGKWSEESGTIYYAEDHQIWSEMLQNELIDKILDAVNETSPINNDSRTVICKKIKDILCEQGVFGCD